MSEELSDVCLVMARDICEKLVGKQYHDTDKASIAAFIYSCATKGALATAIFSEPLSPAMGEEPRMPHSGMTASEAAAFIDRLAALPSPEPVAWQWRPKSGGSWHLMHESAAQADFQRSICEYRPLFAATPSQREVVEMPPTGIRICPERDGPCPHGMECKFSGDRYNCDMVGSRAALATGGRP